MNDQQISAQLDKCTEIFKLINDKDQFENFYRAALSKRLLQNLSVNDTAEKSFIQKLKKECGGPYTQKMDTMIKDVELSKNLNLDFQKYEP